VTRADSDGDAVRRRGDQSGARCCVPHG
jgi:hypothetical protein